MRTTALHRCVIHATFACLWVFAGPVILTFSGKIAEKNTATAARFDLAMLEKLPQPAALQSLLQEYRQLGPDVQALSLAANSELSRKLDVLSWDLLRQNRYVIGLTVLRMARAAANACSRCVHQTW